ncbi:hypothetical protein CF70_013010 [Cupriavidus sp. SK-3]|nr:hypothetical protein CF70_013010 [Cupriavidus sp. SK-3]
MVEIKPEPWSDALLAEVDSAFATHAKSDTSRGLMAPAECVRSGVFCRVYRDGEPVAWYVLRGHKYAHGSEAEIALAHGRADFDLVADVLPLIELQCRAFDAIRIETCRPGLIKKLKRIGYGVDAVVLRKRGNHDSAS